MADRIGWIGEARRRALSAWLERELAAWWSDWSTLDLTPALASDVDDQDLASWLCGGETVAVGSDGALVLAGALVGVGTQDPGALAQYIGEEALGDLVQRLCGTQPPVVPRIAERAALSASITDTRLGAVVLTARMADFQLAVHVSRSVVDRVAPPAASRHVPLAGRRAAISEATVLLTATLDLGDIALAELADLRPGDVIATHALLDTLPSLITRSDGTRIASARLGAHEGRRALLLTHS